MLPILLSLSAWIPALYGWGWPFSWLRRRYYALAAADYVVTESLLGFLVLGTLVTALHFFIAISSGVSAGLLLLGWLLAALRWRADGPRRPPRWALAAGAGWLLVLALAAAAPPQNYDTGLYHLPAIAWLTTGPLALGLGNLHSRLGFNSAWFSVAAALEGPSLAGRSAFVLSPALLWFWGLAISQAVVRLWRARAPAVPDLFLGLSVGALFLSTSVAVFDLSSPSPDLPVFVLTLFLAYVFCHFLAQPAAREYDLLLLVGLSVLAVVVKLSALPLLLLPAAGLLYLGWPQRALVHWRALVLWGGALAAVALAVWALNSFLLSGCWLYPLNLSCWPRTAWSLPHSLVSDTYDWIRSWARQPGQPPAVVLANWNWFWIWLPTTFWQRPFTVPLELFVFGIVGQWLVSRSTAIRGAASPLILYGVLALGVAYWFLSAPDVRFGEGYFWALGLLSMNEWIVQLAQLPAAGAALRRLVPVAVAALAVLVPLNLPLAQVHALRANPRSVLLAWPALPAPALTTFRTADGATINTPTTGDQCWLAPLPCTPAQTGRLGVTQLPGGRWLFTLPPDAPP